MQSEIMGIPAAIGYDVGINVYRCSGGKKEQTKIGLEWPQIMRAPWYWYIAYELQIFPLETKFKSRIKYFQRTISGLYYK